MPISTHSCAPPCPKVAARRATDLGITAYNILEGFEGDLNSQAQRGQRGGWRYRGLPWRQS